MTNISAQAKFPNSINLFRFCFHVLELYNPSKKLNDQCLGQILSFSPSDTSHWKRGKKCLNHKDYLNTLSKYLKIDLDILEDLADGSLQLNEAKFDFSDSRISNTILEKKNKIISNDYEHISQIESIAQAIRKHNPSIKSPVCIFSILNAFPFIQLIPSDSLDRFATNLRVKPGHYIIRHSKNIHKPYTRLSIIREVCKIAFIEKNLEELTYFTASKNDIILLANALLMPHDALAHEVAKVSTRTSLIKFLSNSFCVPKSAVRIRLTTLLNRSAAHIH